MYDYRTEPAPNRLPYKKQAAYWVKQMAEAPQSLRVPVDHPRPPAQCFLRDSASLDLGVKLPKQLNAFCAEEELTPVVLLLGTFYTLLWRYTAQTDIAVGMIAPKASWPRTADLPEQFTNVVALRTQMTEDSTVRRFLTKIAQLVDDAERNRDYPFEELIAALPVQDVSLAPIVQTALVCDPGLGIALGTASPRELTEVAEHLARCDFVIKFLSDRPRIECEYDSALFEPGTISRMLAHFKNLLKGIIAEPGLRLDQLPMLTESERKKVLVEWNDTQVNHPPDLCLHHIVEQQCERTPDTIAVVVRGESLTYRELNSRANQLAHRLRALGVGPETLVGVNLYRSLELPIALLGILKAGGAYVPLDPTFPDDRLAFMLRDAGVRMLLTSRGPVAWLPSGVKVISLADSWSSIMEESEESPPANASPDNLAYVIYTSGSTGQPKGVQIEHRSVVNFLLEMSRRPGLTSSDVLLAVTTLSFDISVLELFVPLIVGAQVIIASEEDVADGPRLLECLADSSVTVMQATPATYRLLLDAGWPKGGHLKLLCGGEALPEPLARELLQRADSLWNMYGPTETTIWSLAHRVTSDDGPVSVGRPIGNTQVYLLDPHGQPVPPGVAGEIYIGGEGVARGYLNRPELTAEKFVSDPFGGALGGRLYRTGDLARYFPDGRLEFLGRLDHQVKIRGYRIEPGEVEIILRAHPEVKDAVVIAGVDDAGARRLAAYIVPLTGRAPAARELCTYLRQGLPEAMIPSVFILLDALPLAPNRKIDRRALPTPKWGNREAGTASVPPTTSTEKAISNIWRKVLGSEEFGIHDNFFDIGGHSLLIAQVHNRLKATLQTNVFITDMFKYPSIHALAKHIDATEAGDSPGDFDHDLMRASSNGKAGCDPCR